MMSATLLSLEDIKKLNNSPFILKAGVSDLAVIQGVEPSYTCVTSEGNSTAHFWVRDVAKHGFCIALEHNSTTMHIKPNCKNEISVRPVIPLSAIPHSTILQTMRHLQDGDEKWSIVQFGHYPQTIVEDEALIENLNMMRSRLAMHEGEYQKGKFGSYAFVSLGEYSQHEVFEADGERYVCVTANKRLYGHTIWKRNKSSFKVKEGQEYWLKVEPIEWILDTKNEKAIALKGLIGGMTFDSSENYDGVFEKTLLSQYLNKHFYPEMVQYQEEDYNIHSLTEFKEMIVGSFTEERLQQYQDNRLNFYMALLKLAKDVSEASCYEGTLKEDMVVYAKDVVKRMTQDEKITPQRAIQKIKAEIYDEKIQISHWQVSGLRQLKQNEKE